jgi:hypothetical protein
MKNFGKLFLLVAIGCGILSSANANGSKWYGCSWSFGKNKEARNTFYKKISEQQGGKDVFSYTAISWGNPVMSSTDLHYTENEPVFIVNVLKRKRTKCDTFDKPDNVIHGPVLFKCEDKQVKGCKMDTGCGVMLVGGESFEFLKDVKANYIDTTEDKVEQGYNMPCAKLFHDHAKTIPESSLIYDFKLDNSSSDDHSH